MIVTIIDSFDRIQDNYGTFAYRGLDLLLGSRGLTVPALRGTFTICRKCGNVILRSFVSVMMHQCSKYHVEDALYPDPEVFLSAALDYPGLTPAEFQHWLVWCKDCDLVVRRVDSHYAVCPGRSINHV